MKPALAPRSVALSGHSALRLHSECSIRNIRRGDPCIVRSREVEAHILRPTALNNFAGTVVDQVQPNSEDVLPVACQSEQITEFKTFTNSLFVQQIQNSRPSYSVSRLVSNGKKKLQVDSVEQPDGQPSASATPTVTVLAYSKAENRWIRVPLSAEQLCDVHEMVVRQNRRSQRKQAERGRRTLMMLCKLWVGTYHVAVAIVHKHTQMTNEAQKLAVKDKELGQTADGTAHKDEEAQTAADTILQLQLEIAKLRGDLQQAQADTLAAQEGQRAAEQKQQQTQLELAEVKEALRQLEMDHRAAEAGGKLARSQLAEAKNELSQALRDKSIAEDAQNEAEKILGWKRSDRKRVEWAHKQERDARNKEEAAIVKMRVELSSEVTGHSRRVRQMLASLLGKDADALPVVSSKRTAEDCVTQESMWRATCGAIRQQLTATEKYAQAAVDKLKTKLGISERPKASEDPLLQILYRKPADTAMMMRRPAPGGQTRPPSLPSDRPAANNKPRSTALPPNRPATNRPTKSAALPPSRPAANHTSRPPGLPMATPAGSHQPRPAAALPPIRTAHDNHSQSAAGTLRHNSRPARGHQSQLALQACDDRERVTNVMETVDDLQETVPVHSKPCSRVSTTTLSADPQLPLPANFMFDQPQPSSPTSPRLFVAVF